MVLIHLLWRDGGGAVMMVVLIEGDSHGGDGDGGVVVRCDSEVVMMGGGCGGVDGGGAVMMVVLVEGDSHGGDGAVVLVAVAAVVMVVLWYQANPNESYLVAVKRFFRYLKGTPNLGLLYTKGSCFDLKAYSDSNYAGCNLDKKSTSGGCQIFRGKLVLGLNNVLISCMLMLFNFRVDATKDFKEFTLKGYYCWLKTYCCWCKLKLLDNVADSRLRLLEQNLLIALSLDSPKTLSSQIKFSLSGFGFYPRLQTSYISLRDKDLQESKDPQVVSELFGELCIRRTFVYTQEPIFISMESLSPQVVSATKLPILNPNEFDLWKMRIKQLARKNELKARGTLLMALPDKHDLKFNIHKDAKTLMEAIQKRFGGNKENKKKLISQLEILGESLSQEDINLKFLRRTHTLIWRNKTDLEDQSLDDQFNSLRIYEAEVKSLSTIGPTIQNIAFVSSQNTNNTNESVSAVASVSAASTKVHVYAFPNVDTLSDVVIYSLFASQSNSPQLDNDDLKQIDADDLDEIDLKWQMAMLTIRARRFIQRTRRNLGANGTSSIGFDMSKVKCYNYHRRGHSVRECRSPKDNKNKEPQRKNVPAEEEPTNYALMAFTSPSSSTSDNETVLIAFNVEPNLTKPTQDMSLSNRLSAPIIEDWVSDSEDESEGEPMSTQKTPSFVHTFEHVKPLRPSVKTVEHPIPAANLKKDIPKPQGHRNSQNRKTCFVCKSLTHLIKDYDYYEKNGSKSCQEPCYEGKSSAFWNMFYLTDFEEINGGYGSFSGNLKGGKITCKGKIRTGKLDFDDVYFVKELKFNLFSVLQICDKKNNVLFIDTKCIVLSLNFKLPDENQVLLRVFTKYNMYNVDLKNIVPSGDLTCLFSKTTLDESNLWHRRLGHINFKTMNKLVKGNLVRGLPSIFLKIIINVLLVRRASNIKHLNRVLVTKPHNKTPYELLLVKIPSIGFMKPFSCPVTILNTLDPLGSGPTWLFDIDTLTKSMNYQQVSAGNQPNSSADHQNTNNDATFEVKEPEFEVKKPESAVHVSPSNSAKTKKHDDKTTKEAKGKSPVKLSIGFRNLTEVLRKFGLTDGKSASTPIDTKKPLLKDPDGEDVDVHTYRSMIGSLMSLTSSRPDIMFVVCACAHFQVTLKASHLHAVKRIFRYLKGKPHLGLWYPKDPPFNLVAYSNNDYVGARLDRKSTTGGCQFLGCRLISWKCKKQTVFATSSTKAEYVAAASCCAQVLWIHNQLLDYGMKLLERTLHVTNVSSAGYITTPQMVLNSPCLTHIKN
nr:hypothetical protein [Tanacetum cinerariifolium]